MYAVMMTGGKQYRIAKGEYLKVEKLGLEEGADVEFDKVLMVADGDDIKVGKPYVDGGLIKAKVKSTGRSKKVSILKFRRRKHYMKRMGHRQDYTEIEITDIVAN